MRYLTAAFFALLVTAGFALPPALADQHVHRLALQISDNDPDKMNAVLNVAGNVVRYYDEKGEEVEVRIVAFNAGLHMLREDTSPVKERLASFSQSMPMVGFDACENTRQLMAKKEGKEPPILPFAESVPSGAVQLITLGEDGWTILRP